MTPSGLNEMIDRHMRAIDEIVQRTQDQLDEALGPLNTVSRADLAHHPGYAGPVLFWDSTPRVLTTGNLDPLRPMLQTGVKHIATCFDLTDSTEQYIAVSKPEFLKRTAKVVDAFVARVTLLKHAATFRLAFLKIPTVSHSMQAQVCADGLACRLSIWASVYALALIDTKEGTQA